MGLVPKPPDLAPGLFTEDPCEGGKAPSQENVPPTQLGPRGQDTQGTRPRVTGLVSEACH